ncbi:electron transfer flavoprotein subunit beta/FixA family protein [Clostridium sp. AN503]|jgi:electron transfer flavoprotein alpha/beta subunit|uniref:electron transfer flavoprotein subunit beta/FixA family protein n=1 Tax=Clostridium sp. AN503 TaxID=3160598 RepID=UPI003457ED7E
MNIVVCVKQVPDTTEIRIDPVKHTLIREGVPSIVNPFDACALEMAVRLKEKEGGKVTVISMGPAQAKNALKECLSVGADQAFLVTDRAFGGSDTLATSYILSRAIKAVEAKTGEKTDLILCGKQAIDGDTAQVGPEIAEHMDLPHVTLATGVELVDGKLQVLRDTDEGHDVVEVDLPALVTATKTPYDPRYPSIKSKMAANRAVITEITNSDPDMVCEQERLGLNGSPTKVKKTFTPDQSKNGVVIRGETGEDAAVRLAAMLSDAKII